MKFSHYDLGYRSGGEIVVVEMSNNPVFVRMMDDTNFKLFLHGKKYNYYNGPIISSTVKLITPHAGRWHITVDVGNKIVPIRSSVRVFPQYLSPLNEGTLLSIPSLVRTSDHSKYDVYITYALEDEEIGNPLVKELHNYKLKVFVDKFSVKIGDILKRRIDKGTSESRMSIIILSRAFLDKGWTSEELDSLVTLDTTGEQIILPVWHNVSRKDIAGFSSLLANKLARSTSSTNVNKIAAEVRETLEITHLQEVRKFERIMGRSLLDSQPLPLMSHQSHFLTYV